MARVTLNPGPWTLMDGYAFGPVPATLITQPSMVAVNIGRPVADGCRGGQC